MYWDKRSAEKIRKNKRETRKVNRESLSFLPRLAVLRRSRLESIFINFVIPFLTDFLIWNLYCRTRHVDVIDGIIFFPVSDNFLIHSASLPCSVYRSLVDQSLSLSFIISTRERKRRETFSWSKQMKTLRCLLIFTFDSIVSFISYGNFVKLREWLWRIKKLIAR